MLGILQSAQDKAMNQTAEACLASSKRANVAQAGEECEGWRGWISRTSGTPSEMSNRKLKTGI